MRKTPSASGGAFRSTSSSPATTAPGTLAFCDPPYWACEDNYGPGLFAPTDHALLRDCLAAVQGRFILTINDVPEIRDLYADERFSIEPVGVTYGLSSSGPTQARELIITGGSCGV